MSNDKKLRTREVTIKSPLDYGPESVCRQLGLACDPGAPGERETFRLRLVLLPSFHPEVSLTFQGDAAGGTASLRTGQVNFWYLRTDPQNNANENSLRLHEATGAVPLLAWQSLWQTVNRVDPHNLRGRSRFGADGMTVHGYFRDHKGLAHFEEWSPTDTPVAALVEAAYAAVEAAITTAEGQRAIEQLHGYLFNRLGWRVLAGPPYILRIFGMISSRYEDELRAVFEAVPTDVPALVDLTGLDGMGTLLHPAFREFHAAFPHVHWAASPHAREHLINARIPASVIHDTVEGALHAVSRKSA